MIWIDISLKNEKGANKNPKGKDEKTPYDITDKWKKHFANISGDLATTPFYSSIESDVPPPILLISCFLIYLANSKNFNLVWFSEDQKAYEIRAVAKYC